ncbi:hypothetical protein COU57_03575 [Candidatus Pacearchaeota archaeon CG10_big_fil_rev_8_21_14_0_10_32_14]|nr:MAG: hypothetical protein COU57_03575 [Candidatus Pacearchaeota archaeon CG10_big_fil_rev_8_21_14_0_10_32_14]
MNYECPACHEYSPFAGLCFSCSEKFRGRIQATPKVQSINPKDRVISRRAAQDKVLRAQGLNPETSRWLDDFWASL